MKLLRYGPAGHEQPGLLDAHGRIRSLAGSIPDLTPQHLSPASPQAARGHRPGLAARRAGRPTARCALRRHPQVHRHRPELRRPRRGVESAHPGRAGRLHQGGELPAGAQRRRHAAAGLEKDRLGGRARRRDRHDGPLRGGARRARARRRLLRRQRRLRARVSSSSAAAPGTRARAATPSAPSAPGS